MFSIGLIFSSDLLCAGSDVELQLTNRVQHYSRTLQPSGVHVIGASPAHSYIAATDVTSHLDAHSDAGVTTQPCILILTSKKNEALLLIIECEPLRPTRGRPDVLYLAPTWLESQIVVEIR